jgi:hypothetical protein
MIADISDQYLDYEMRFLAEPDDIPMLEFENSLDAYHHMRGKRCRACALEAATHQLERRTGVLYVGFDYRNPERPWYIACRTHGRQDYASVFEYKEKS